MLLLAPTEAQQTSVHSQPLQSPVSDEKVTTPPTDVVVDTNRSTNESTEPNKTESDEKEEKEENSKENESSDHSSSSSSSSEKNNKS